MDVRHRTERRDDAAWRDWASASAQTFADIVVHPTEHVLRMPGPLFRGGPDWPRFALRSAARHCWYTLPIPVDARPTPAAEPVRDLREAGVWCGPITFHFGHAIADFGMRIAASRCLYPDVPLVFSIWDVPGAAPPPCFWEIAEHLGVDRARIVLIDKPTMFERLHVLPQAERPYGGGPSRRHLDFMDRLVGEAPASDGSRVYVSRAGLAKGRFAGETILEAALAGAGYTIFRPETVPLDAQMALYRRARHLIFAEGSALHALQLLGRVEADVTVLIRRPWRRIAASSLRSRVRSLRYLNVVRGLVYGLRASGHAQPAAGISILDPKRCLAKFRDMGIDLHRHWDPSAFAAAQEQDLSRWIARRLAGASHAGERAMIDKRLRALAIRL